MHTNASSHPSFAAWVKQQRKALDLTQVELARLVGCAAVTIQKIEEGRRRPSRQIAELLAHHLAIPAGTRDSFLLLARVAAVAAAPIEPPAASEERLGRAASAKRQRIPAPLTPLVGRESEITAVLRLLARTDIRLITLLGPPGVGKTRLSIAVAWQSVDAFGDGVCFTPLAAITDSSLVLPALAHALDLDLGALAAGSQQSALTTALVEHLHDKQMLLVLDNCEQVLDAAAEIAQLLVSCPRIKALVTSRTPLHLSGENEVVVAPLAAPTLTETTPMAVLAANDAIRLFITRVQAFQPDFELTPANAQALVEICARLEGIPLAIELAAARLRQFTPAHLAAHLQNPSGSVLPLLTQGPRDLPSRHQTLRSALAWSYDLLTPAEQVLFRQLGVFVGGCTTDAVEALSQSSPHHTAELLARLASHHLLRIEPRVMSEGADSVPPSSGLRNHAHPTPHSVPQSSGLRNRESQNQPRVIMLETIREFALEQLAACGEEAACRRQHANVFLATVVEAERHKRDRSKRAWMDRLEDDLDNLRAALQWALAAEPSLALALAGGMRTFWYTRGYFREGRRWLIAALAAHPQARTAARAQALLAYAQIEEQLGDLTAALRLAEEGLAIYQTLGDQPGIAEALRTRGWIESDLGRMPAALVSFQESLQRFRQLDDKTAIAEQLGAVVYCLCHGEVDYDQVKAYLDESLRLFRAADAPDGISFALERVGDLEIRFGRYQAAENALHEATLLYREMGARYSLASALTLLGEAHWLQGEWQKAQACWEESLSLFQELQVKWGVMILHHHLGQVERRAGNLAAAAGRYRQSLSLAWAMQHERMVGRGLAGLGAVALAAGDIPRALTLLAAAQRQIEALSPFLAPGDRNELAQTLASAQARPHDPDYARAWLQGQSMPLAEAIARALA